ncbi:MAG TPA: pentapeptide repeat-containing protein [Kamptonema sp.]|nr:pentapeptide repeat-containing protein [Kamptonema sp.]
MAQSHKLNFSNQDLRNRCFKGVDLTGADFSGSDIRGCNFSKAILRGANFERVRCGQSRRRVSTLIARAGGVAIAVTMAGAFAGLIAGVDAGAAAVAGTAAVAVAITRVEAGIVAGAIAGAAAVIGANGIITFLGGDYVRGILLFLASGVILGLAAIVFFQAVAEVEKLSITSFKDADLTNAKFDEAMIEDTDFSGAIGWRL